MATAADFTIQIHLPKEIWQTYRIFHSKKKNNRAEVDFKQDLKEHVLKHVEGLKNCIDSPVEDGVKIATISLAYNNGLLLKALK